MDRHFDATLTVGQGLRLTLDDPEWLKRSDAFTHALTASPTLLESLVRIAEKTGIESSERLFLWFFKNATAWPEMKTFLLVRDATRTGADVFRDRGFRSQDAAVAASKNAVACKTAKKELASATPSSVEHSSRQDLVAPSPSVTERELLSVCAAMAIVDEYGAPNPVKLKPSCCRAEEVGLLLRVAFGSGGRGGNSDGGGGGGGGAGARGGEERKQSKPKGKQKQQASGTAGKGDTIAAPTAAWSRTPTDAWRCLFARSVDAVFFKAAIEKGHLLVPLDVDDCPADFYALVPDRDAIVLVLDDCSDACLLSEYESRFSAPLPPPCGHRRRPLVDWGGRGHPSPGKINVGFELHVSDVVGRAPGKREAKVEEKDDDDQGVQDMDLG